MVTRKLLSAKPLVPTCCTLVFVTFPVGFIRLLLETHYKCLAVRKWCITNSTYINPLNSELNPICYLLALLGAYHFLHVNRIRVKLLTFRLLMSYIYGISRLRVNKEHLRIVADEACGSTQLIEYE